MNFQSTKIFLCIILIYCVVVGCTFNSEIRQKNAIDEISKACQKTTTADCLELVRQKYTQTIEASHKRSLLHIALEMFLKHGQFPKATEAFHRIITLSSEDKTHKDDTWMCHEVDFLQNVAVKHSAWLFLEQIVEYIQALKLDLPQICQESANLTLATALSEQRKFARSNEILELIKSNGVSAGKRDPVDFLLAQNAFLSDEYDQCIRTLTRIETQEPKTQLQGSMALLLTGCLDLTDKQDRALSLLDNLRCCPTVVDLELVKLKKSVIEKRQATYQENL